MSIAVTILTAGLIQVAAAPPLGDGNDSTESAETIVAEHMDRLPLDDGQAVVINHDASRVVTDDDPQAGIIPDNPRRAAVESRLIRRYRVDADGRHHVEYDDSEGKMRNARVRRLRHDHRHHHHHALDGLAVGLALGLPYVASHNYDRHNRHGYRSYRHGYRSHTRAHRKHRRHHRRWW